MHPFRPFEIFDEAPGTPGRPACPGSPSSPGIPAWPESPGSPAGQFFAFAAQLQLLNWLLEWRLSRLRWNGFLLGFDFWIEIILNQASLAMSLKLIISTKISSCKLLIP